MCNACLHLFKAFLESRRHFTWHAVDLELHVLEVADVELRSECTMRLLGNEYRQRRRATLGSIRLGGHDVRHFALRVLRMR